MSRARLADFGHRRTPSVAHLKVAATAELAGLTVVRLDEDLDVISGSPDSLLNASSWRDSSR